MDGRQTDVLLRWIDQVGQQRPTLITRERQFVDMAGIVVVSDSFPMPQSPFHVRHFIRNVHCWTSQQWHPARRRWAEGPPVRPAQGNALVVLHKYESRTVYGPCRVSGIRPGVYAGLAKRCPVCFRCHARLRASFPLRSTTRRPVNGPDSLKSLTHSNPA